MKILFKLTLAVIIFSTQMFAEEKCYQEAEKCDCKKASKKKLASASKKKPACSCRLASNSKNKNKKKLSKALALRNAAKENKKLKDELDALRKANLIAAAKQAEKPGTAKLAENTETTAPKMTIVTEELAPAPIQAERNPFFSNIENTFSRDINKSSDNPIYNTLKGEVGYKPLEKFGLSIAPAVGWKWNNTKAGESSFEFKNLPISVFHDEVFKFEKINSFLKASATFILPTNSNDRNNGLIMGIQGNVTFHTDFNNGKGNVEIFPGFGFDIRQNTTAAPATDPTTIKDENTFTTADGAKFEKLSPNTQYTLSIGSSFEYRFIPQVGVGTWFKFNFNKKYSDSVLYSGNLLTITPDLWENKLEIGLKTSVNITSQLSSEIGIATKGLVAGYRPFSTQDSNEMAAWLKFKYCF